MMHGLECDAVGHRSVSDLVSSGFLYRLFLTKDDDALREWIERFRSECLRILSRQPLLGSFLDSTPANSGGIHELAGSIGLLLGDKTITPIRSPHRLACV